MAAMQFRPFTKMDWYAWAGAEPFADGSEPLIYENDRFVVVASANGVDAVVQLGDDPKAQMEPNEGIFMLRPTDQLTSAGAQQAAAAIALVLDGAVGKAPYAEALKALGMTEG